MGAALLVAGLACLTMAGGLAEGTGVWDGWTAHGDAMGPDGSLHEITVVWSGGSSTRLFTVTLATPEGAIESTRTFRGITSGGEGAIPLGDMWFQGGGAWSTDPEVSFEARGVVADTLWASSTRLAGNYGELVISIGFGDL